MLRCHDGERVEPHGGVVHVRVTYRIEWEPEPATLRLRVYPPKKAVLLKASAALR